jgi:N-acyl-D-amino-acid deacylase
MPPTLPALVVVTALLALAAGAQPAPADLVIRGGWVIDGAGNPPYRADVALRGGRIVEIGRVAQPGREEWEAAGLTIAPGFVDVHTHSENLPDQPIAENFLRMGVTTLVTGNCGNSEVDLAGFFQRVEAARPAVNIASLIGHNSVRARAMQRNFDRAPTDAELERMGELVEQGMKDGAVGFSTGLIYQPGTFARTEEIIALARIAGAHDGVYATHMRHEDERILTALGEALRICREARVRGQISHLKLAGKQSWGRTALVLGALEEARAEGLEITQDQYAYTRSSTGLSTLLPDSALEGGKERLRERLADPERRAAVVAEMRRSLTRKQQPDYAYVQLAAVPPDPSLNGKTLPEAARLRTGEGSLEAQIETILALVSHPNPGRVTAVFDGMSEDDVRAFMRHPHTMVASDAGPNAEKGEGVPHPRGFGNNARVLGAYVREARVLRLEDAVRRMTSLPAQTFRLRDRGLLRPGAWADLVVFDPATVRDRATFGDPRHFAEGFRDVLVNGVAVIRNGRLTEARPGKALRHGRD